MKLKSINGKVPYIMAAGKDFVKDEMSLAAAEQIWVRFHILTNAGRVTIQMQLTE